MSKMFVNFEFDLSNEQDMALARNLLMSVGSNNASVGIPTSIVTGAQKVEYVENVTLPLIKAPVTPAPVTPPVTPIVTQKGTAIVNKDTLKSEELDEHGYPKNLLPPLTPEKIAENKAAIKATEARKEALANGDLTIEMVRAMLAKKVDNHRQACKAKLAELNTTSVTTMDPAKYQEFYDFLSALN